MVDSQYLSDAQTRNLKIDVLLKEQSWNISDRTHLLGFIDGKPHVQCIHIPVRDVYPLDLGSTVP